jgi:hypothetical protein
MLPHEYPDCRSMNLVSSWHFSADEIWRRIDRIGRVPFTIKVVDDEEIKAFALPGGFFFVNTGVLLNADNEAEMAGVMAHEIGHVGSRHGTRQVSRTELARKPDFAADGIVGRRPGRRQFAPNDSVPGTTGVPNRIEIVLWNYKETVLLLGKQVLSRRRHVLRSGIDQSRRPEKPTTRQRHR